MAFLLLSLSTQGNGVPFPNQRPYLAVTTEPPFWGAMLEETPLGGPHAVNLQGTVFLWLGGAVAGLTGAVRERRSTPQGEVGDLSRPVSTTKIGFHGALWVPLPVGDQTFASAFEFFCLGPGEKKQPQNERSLGKFLYFPRIRGDL